MSTPSESLPKDLAAAHAMILAERAARDVERMARLKAEAAVAKAQTDRIVLDLELERLRFQLAKARRAAFGQSSEAGARIGQLEFALEDIEETLAVMRTVDEMADTTVAAFARRKPARRPLPDHLPRVRQVYPQSLGVPVLRRSFAQARRRRHRDARTRPGELIRHPARAREVLLPDL